MNPQPRHIDRRPHDTRVGRPLPHWVRHVVDGIGVILLLCILYGLVDRNVRTQGDFHTYHTAGRAVRMGLDPYVQANLSALSDRTVFPFLYPPITLLPCMALASVPLATAKVTWMCTQVVLLIALVLLWAKRLLREEMLLPVALCAMFAWNASSMRNIVTGNIAILEAMLVWAGITALLAGRRRLFAVLIVVAAMSKLAPGLFLLLLLLPHQGRRLDWKLFCASVALLLLLALGPLVVGPAAHFRDFWRGIPNSTVTGIDNPTVIGFTLSMLASAGINLFGVALAPYVIWACYAAILIAISLPFLSRCYRGGDERKAAMAAVFVYLLLMPRPMAYGFVMLVPVPLYFAPRPFTSRAGRWLLVLMLSAQGLLKATSVATASPFFTYAPFLLMLCTWLLVLNEAAEAETPLRAGRGGWMESAKQAA